MKKDIDLDEKTFLEIEWEIEDQSFDHAFGRTVVKGASIKRLRVITYIAGFDFDVTDSMPEKFMRYLESYAIDKLNESIEV